MGLLRRTGSFLKESIPSEPHLWVAIIAGVVYAVIEMLDGLTVLHLETHYTVVISVIMFFLMMLSIDGIKNRHKMAEANKNLNKIMQCITAEKKVALRARPSGPNAEEEYNNLWGGFTGTYSVYNPSYTIDKVTGEQAVANIFIHRYQNPHFKKARYIFLIGDDAGRADLMIFCRLMKLVKKSHPDVVNKIEVKVIEKKRSDESAEMYLGVRDGMATAVVELRDPVLGAKHGKPNYYLIIRDPEVIERHLKPHFNEAWDDLKQTFPYDVFA